MRHQRRDPFGHALQESVASRTAEGIVEFLEALEIDQRYRERLGCGRRDELGQSFLEQRAVREPRQRVVIREALRLLVHFQELERERYVPGEVLQQAHFGGIEMPRVGGIKREHANSPTAPKKRNFRERAKATRARLLAQLLGASRCTPCMTNGVPVSTARPDSPKSGALSTAE